MSEKVTLFLPSLNGGGAERAMVNLAKGLSKFGFHVDLVLVKATGPYLAQVPQSVRVFDLKSKRVLKSLFPLVNYLRKERPKVVISALNHVNVITILAKQITGVDTRLIITEHSTLSVSQKHAQNKRSKFIPVFMRYLYPLADQVVAVSKGVAKDLACQIRLPIDKIKVIYNPIIDDQLLEKSWQKIEHPWFVDKRAPIILSVGRLTVAKDYPTLIKAFAQVRKQIPAKLVILGEGEERSELEKLVNSLGLYEDVWMPGFVENPYAYMRNANVFVLSSKWEGFGNVIVEALACDCPVIATDCPSGPKEILENGKYGTLVPVGDDKILAEKIKETLQSKKIQTNNKIKVYQLFSIETVANQYLSLISDEHGDY